MTDTTFEELSARALAVVKPRRLSVTAEAGGVVYDSGVRPELYTYTLYGLQGRASFGSF